MAPHHLYGSRLLLLEMLVILLWTPKSEAATLQITTECPVGGGANLPAMLSVNPAAYGAAGWERYPPVVPDAWTRLDATAWAFQPRIEPPIDVHTRVHSDPPRPLRRRLQSSPERPLLTAPAGASPALRRVTNPATGNADILRTLARTGRQPWQQWLPDESTAVNPAATPASRRKMHRALTSNIEFKVASGESIVGHCSEDKRGGGSTITASCTSSIGWTLSGVCTSDDPLIGVQNTVVTPLDYLHLLTPIDIKKAQVTTDGRILTPIGSLGAVSVMAREVLDKPDPPTTDAAGVFRMGQGDYIVLTPPHEANQGIGGFARGLASKSMESGSFTMSVGLLLDKKTVRPSSQQTAAVVASLAIGGDSQQTAEQVQLLARGRDLIVQHAVYSDSSNDWSMGRAQLVYPEALQQGAIHIVVKQDQEQVKVQKQSTHVYVDGKLLSHDTKQSKGTIDIKGGSNFRVTPTLGNLANQLPNPGYKNYGYNILPLSILLPDGNGNVEAAAAATGGHRRRNHHRRLSSAITRRLLNSTPPDVPMFTNVASEGSQLGLYSVLLTNSAMNDRAIAYLSELDRIWVPNQTTIAFKIPDDRCDDNPPASVIAQPPNTQWICTEIWPGTIQCSAECERPRWVYGGDAGRPAAVVRCSNDQWQTPVRWDDCKPAPCEQPPLVGTVPLPTNAAPWGANCARTPSDAVCIADCQPGFVRGAVPPSVKCSFGEWQPGSVHGSCVPAGCPADPALALADNGAWPPKCKAGLANGQACDVICNPGYAGTLRAACTLGKVTVTGTPCVRCGAPELTLHTPVEPFCYGAPTMSAAFSLLAPGILGITSFASLVDSKAVTTPPAAPMPGSFPEATLVAATVASPMVAALEPGQHRLVLLASYELAPPCSGADTATSQEVLFTVTPAPALQVVPVLPASRPCPGEPFSAEFDFSITGLTASKGAVRVQGTAGFVETPASTACDVKVVKTVTSPDATAASGRMKVTCASPATPFQVAQAIGVKLSLTAGQDGCGSSTADATIRTTIACCLSTGAFVKFSDSSVTAPSDAQAKCLHMVNPFLYCVAGRTPSSAAMNKRKEVTSMPPDLYGFVNKGATSNPPFTGRTISLVAGIDSQCASSMALAAMSPNPALDAASSSADDSSRVVGFQLAVPRGSDIRSIRFWVACTKPAGVFDPASTAAGAASPAAKSTAPKKSAKKVTGVKATTARGAEGLRGLLATAELPPTCLRDWKTVPLNKRTSSFRPQVIDNPAVAPHTTITWSYTLSSTAGCDRSSVFWSVFVEGTFKGLDDSLCLAG